VLGPCAGRGDAASRPKPRRTSKHFRPGLLSCAPTSVWRSGCVRRDASAEVTQVLASYVRSPPSSGRITAHHVLRLWTEQRCARFLLPELRRYDVRYLLRAPPKACPAVLRSFPMMRITGSGLRASGLPLGPMKPVRFAATRAVPPHFITSFRRGYWPIPRILRGYRMPADAGDIRRLARPAALCAMNASATVELACDSWFIRRTPLSFFGPREPCAVRWNGVLVSGHAPCCGRRSLSSARCASAERSAEYAKPSPLQTLLARWEYRCARLMDLFIPLSPLSSGLLRPSVKLVPVQS